jgi:3-oxoacyl-[acyl-carrier protein] reductase
VIRADLGGRVALVTGAARGIGAAIARRLAANGAFVVANYAKSEGPANALVEAIRSAGGRAEAAKADVSVEAEADALVRGAVERHGRLDVLVNNAGIAKDALLVTTRTADWRRVLDVDLDGVFYASRRGVEAMWRAGNGGRIVNVASVSAIRGGRGQANYAAAKGAVVSFTRAVALETAERGITVNAVLPGFVDTDMTARVKRAAGTEILARIPMARFGTPEDVAGLALYLASDDAAYVTGQAFVVDGGLTIG